MRVRHRASASAQSGLKTLVKYRTPKNYKDGDWLGARIGDKFFMTTLMWCARMHYLLLLWHHALTGARSGRCTGAWAATSTWTTT